MLAGCASSVPGDHPCVVLERCCESINPENLERCQNPWVGEGETLTEVCAREVRHRQENSGECISGDEPQVEDPLCGSHLLFDGSLDLLFVVDTSESMFEEQARLSAEIPEVIQTLVTGDIDGDGVQEMAPVLSLNVGVVTSDIGVGGAPLDGCQGDGDNAHFVGADCGVSPGPGFLNFDPEAPVDEAAAHLRCMIERGAAGCSRQQPLEAMGRVLAAETSPGGFFRPGAPRAVILLTDADDCSAADPRVFDRNNPRYSGSISERCARHAHDEDTIRPLEHYVELLAAQTPYMFFGAIAGVPPEFDEHCGEGGDCPSGNTCFAFINDERPYCIPDGIRDRWAERLLQHPRMLPESSAACSSDAGTAEPARRIVEMAREVEANGGKALVSSICSPDYKRMFGYLYDSVVAGACLSVFPDTCYFTEFGPSDCSDRPGRTLLSTTGGQYRCRLDRAENGRPGWYRDESSHYCFAPGPLRFTPGVQVLGESRFVLSCFEGPEEPVRDGTPCEADPNICSQGSLGDVSLVCDPLIKLCRAPCEHSLQCPLGFDCRRQFYGSEEQYCTSISGRC